MLIGRAADGSNLNVSAAVDTGKAVQQQRENDQQTTEAPAYQVELSGAKESYKSHWVEKGNTAYLLHHADQSLEDELAEMQAGIDEILSRPRNGIIKSANASLDNLPDSIERVDLSTLPKEELTPELKAAMAELDRIPPPWANIKIDITPRPDITTIKSQHYTWTFVDGLKENPTITDTSHGIFNHKKPVDALSEDDTNDLATLQAGWLDYVKNHHLIDNSKVTKNF